MQPKVVLESKDKKRTQKRQLKKKKKVLWGNFESKNPLTTN